MLRTNLKQKNSSFQDIVNCLNNQSRSLAIIDNKLNGLRESVEVLGAAVQASDPNDSPFKAEQVSMAENEGRRMIRLMSSTSSEVQNRANYLQCLDALGFPVETTLEDVSDYILAHCLCMTWITPKL